MTWNKQVQVGTEDIKKLTANSKWKSREEEMSMRNFVHQTVSNRNHKRGKKHEVEWIMSRISITSFAAQTHFWIIRCREILHFFHEKFVSFKTVIFWDVTPCSLVDKNCFRGTCGLHLATWISYESTLLPEDGDSLYHRESHDRWQWSQ